MHTNSWKKCLALALTLITVALLLPALSFSVQAAEPTNRYISAEELNRGTATDSIYEDGDTIVVTGDTPLEIKGFLVFANFSDNGKSFHIELNDATTEIPAKAFTNKNEKKGLLSIKGDGVVTIRTQGVRGWDTLESIDFPNAQFIEYYAFILDTALTKVNLPKFEGPPAALTPPDYGNPTPLEQMFFSCTSLESIELPALTIVGNQMFYNCTSLKSADLPAVKELKHQAFVLCSKLTTVNVPKLKKIEGWAFALYGSTSPLTTLYYPDVQPQVTGVLPYTGVADGLTIYVENPGDPSYDDMSNFPAGTTVRKKETASGGNSSSGPATPEGVGGGLVGNFPATSAPKEELTGDGAVSQKPLGTAIVTARRLNVRPTADTSLRPLGRLRKGVQIEVLDIENNFAQIKYQGTYAYVSLDYLKLNFDLKK